MKNVNEEEKTDIPSPANNKLGWINWAIKAYNKDNKFIWTAILIVGTLLGANMDSIESTIGPYILNKNTSNCCEPLEKRLTELEKESKDNTELIKEVFEQVKGVK